MTNTTSTPLPPLEQLPTDNIYRIHIYIDFSMATLSDGAFVASLIGAFAGGCLFAAFVILYARSHTRTKAEGEGAAGV